MVEEDMRRLGTWVVDALRHHEDDGHLENLRCDVEAFCSGFPVPGIGTSG
jgi:glycine/serine hydroxymethyltransferase